MLNGSETVFINMNLNNNIETSLMVTDYPEPPEEKTREVAGRISITYTFYNIPVPEEWDKERIEQDIKENLSDYIDDAIIDIDDIEIYGANRSRR